MHFKTLPFLGLIVALCSLNACTALGLATGAGAVGGIAAAREGGLSQSTTDARIKLEINDLWLKYDFEAFRKLSTTVEQGRVLVTGVVQDPDQRVEAIRLAWQPKGVVQVINEVRVENSDGITGFARDTWIAGNLRTKLIFDRDVQSINYSIDAVQGTVYLMGIAQDQRELNKVVSHARNTNYVKQVVSYVKLAGEPVAGTANASVNNPQGVAATATVRPVAPSNNTQYGTPVAPSDPYGMDANYSYDNNGYGSDYSGGYDNNDYIGGGYDNTPTPPRSNEVYSEPLY